MSEDKPNMPSLLMQAARSAAIADGLLTKKDNVKASKTNANVPKPQGKAKERPNGDTVAAALAMLAASNGNKAAGHAALRMSKMDQGGGGKNNIGAGVGSARAAPAPSNGVSNSNTPSPSMPVVANNLSNASTNSSGASNTANVMHSLRQQSSAASQQKQRHSGHPASNPSSAGSAAHRLAVASSIPVAPKPNIPASSHIQQSTPPAPRSSAGSGGSSGKKKGPPLRRGKWTPEEEAYANRLIMEFKAGLLPLTDGTTLRTFLSKLLNCDPMRISKKFVGSNCIGKQVFRRRTADINRLTTDQIQQSRAELSDLERRFLERVAQTNRVKSSGVNNNANNGNSSAVSSSATAAKMKLDELENSAGATPPWLRPPNGFKHGTGAATAAATLSSGSNRAAMAGRALLQGDTGGMSKNGISSGMNGKADSAGLLALMEYQQRQNKDNMFSQSLSNSANNLLAAAAVAEGKNGNEALAQISRNVSAAKMAGLTSGNSMTNLMLKTGLSRDHLSQLVRDHRNSSNSLSNMMERQSSLDALMSLDFQSLQSIDNLANLIQTGRGNQAPRSGLKNWSSESGNNLAASVESSSGNLSSLANARRMQSEGRMENLIRSLSSGNVANRGQNSGGSNANFSNLLQSMQNNLGGSSNSLLGSASAINLANMLRVDSSTGLTALRMQDGLAQRNSSVDDFLSLVASGDIPHQDPHMLNVPLQSVLQQQQNNSSAAAQFLAQQQLLAQAAGGGGNAALQRFASLSGLSNNNNSGMSNNNTSSLGERIASLGGLANHNSAASLLSQYASQQGSNSASAALAQQQQQANAMNASVLAAAAQQGSDLKRKFSTDSSSNNQGPSKR